VIVRYLANATPQNRSASDVTATSATLNGLLANVGPSACAVCLLWGAETNAWANTHWFNDGKSGANWTNNTPFSQKVSGLAPNKTYFHTLAAKNDRERTMAEAPLAFITGEVNLKAAQEQAWEKGPDGATVPAAFVVSRPASCVEAPLPVAYRVTGTASNGLDYPLLSGVVTIPAGRSEAEIQVAPVNDRMVEGEETVIVTLLPGPYVVGPRQTATVTIVDTVLRMFYVSPDATPAPPYDTWATGYTHLQHALADPATANDAVIHLAGGKTFSGPALGEGDADNTVFLWRNATNVCLLGGYRADAKLAAAAHPGPRDAGPTILSGAGAQSRVLTLTAVGSVTLEQLAIRDGQPQRRHGHGGGLHLTGCRNVVLRDCEIASNRNAHTFVGLGGGLYLRDSEAAAENTTIAGNRTEGPDSYGGGIYVHRDSRLKLTRSTIRDNEARTTAQGAARGGASFVVFGGVIELEETTVTNNKP